MSDDLRIAVLGVGMMGAFHVDALSKRVREHGSPSSMTSSPTRRPRWQARWGACRGRSDCGHQRSRC